MSAHNDLGKMGESLAASFMEAKGYQILDSNYRYQRAEIDLVALRLDPAEVIFIEVKTRSDTRFTFPEESVSAQKKKLIFKAADSYLYEKQLQTVPVRFDIISIGMDNPAEPTFHHIEDAFRLDDFSLGKNPLGL